MALTPLFRKADDVYRLNVYGENVCMHISLCSIYMRISQCLLGVFVVEISNVSTFFHWFLLMTSHWQLQTGIVRYYQAGVALFWFLGMLNCLQLEAIVVRWRQNIKLYIHVKHTISNHTFLWLTLDCIHSCSENLIRRILVLFCIFNEWKYSLYK